MLDIIGESRTRIPYLFGRSVKLNDRYEDDPNMSEYLEKGYYSS